MLQGPQPADYVLATNTAYSVRDFVQMAFEHIGLDWEDYVEYDSRYDRPTEVDALVGDYSKAKEQLGWKPKVLTPDLVKIMVDADMQQLDDELSGRLVRIDR
jgi:GDPmannose 4,6-dehydratase